MCHCLLHFSPRCGLSRQVIDGACDSQLLMVDFVSAVKVLPMDTLIQTVAMVIKQPPPTTHSGKVLSIVASLTISSIVACICDRQLIVCVPLCLFRRRRPSMTSHTRGAHLQRSMSLEVSMLQFFYAFLQRQPTKALEQAWAALYTLVRDASQLATALPPPAHFILLA